MNRISLLFALTLCCSAALMAGACDGGSDPTTEPKVDWIVGGLGVDGALVTDRTKVPVQRVEVGADGFVVVWNSTTDGAFTAPPIGTLYLKKGNYTDQVVALDSPIAGEAIRISVHADDPADQAFTASNTEISSTKDRVMRSAAGAPVVGTLALPNLPPIEPYQIDVADQTITVKPPKIDAYVTAEDIPKYLVISNENGDVLGTERVWQKGGRSYPVSVTLPPSWTPVPLVASLVEADGNEADLSKPVLNLAGQPVTATFNATRPPDNALTVADQNLASFGYKIAVGEAKSDELPAWVAVYADDAGARGELLGAFFMESSPKVKFSVDLTRFVEPTETLWVAMHADSPADGELTAADPLLRGADGADLLVSIDVTNASCDGLKTKFCDPAKPGVLSWLDRCDKVAKATTLCANNGTCDDSGAYVYCKTPPDPCAGNKKKVCVASDPYRVYWENGCGVADKVAFACGATSLCDDSEGEAGCSVAPSCEGNSTLVCDPSDLTKIHWLDKCGELNGNSLPCGATAQCDDSGGLPACVTTGACAGNKKLVCNPADLTKIYWLDNCDEYSGATLPCGNGYLCDDSDGDPGCVNSDVCSGNAELVCNPADPENISWLDHCGELNGNTLPCGTGFVCDDEDGDPHCVNPNPCLGVAQKFCDPADLSVIKWLDGCGVEKASTLPCGSGYQCDDSGAEPVCKQIDTCGGDTSTVCQQGDPSNVYWVDKCGELTGNTYPCGVASCDDSGGEATCTVLKTCADTKLRVCDPKNPDTVLLTNACGDDLGVFKTCANGNLCTEGTPGEATCGCVPTDELTCFGKHFLYEPSGIKKLDSCGNPSGPVVKECALGEICAYEDPVNAKNPVCTTSLSDPSGEMGHRGCSFIDYVTYKTDLAVDCRCRRHAADNSDFYGYDTSGNIHCQNQHASFEAGWTIGDGPHFRHLLHNFQGGGVYSPATKEIFATMQYTDPTYQGAGMVIGYHIKTGARRVVSGRYPNEATGYQMFGSGYESKRSVGTQLFEDTTFPGAWDLEQGADGKLYVWGSTGGNKEITRVDPTTGARTLVWMQELEGATSASTFGQCYSNRAKSTWFGGVAPVQLEDHAFAMGPDGSFYLGFRNAIEGNGVVKISPDGKTCTVLSRWNGTMGEVGAGIAPQYSNIEGFGIHAGKLYATLQIGKKLLSIDIATGARTVIANPPGSVESTTGQSTMFWDSTRNLLFTGGGVQSYLGVVVDVTSGKRQAVFLTAPGEMIESAPPWETGAHGAIDNANYQGYGALVLDPDNNDHIYLVIKWGLLKYEMSTGNSYVMSQ
jgi:hypothetical protein